MKQFSFLFLLVAFGMSSFGANIPGSQCGLTDTTSDNWEHTKWIDLATAGAEQINALSTLTKQQLIIAAKYEAAKYSESKIYNTVQAVEYLRHNSDARFLRVEHFTYREQRFTQVLHFPGDNPYGVIFEQGTLHVVAYNSDDSISCREVR